MIKQLKLLMTAVLVCSLGLNVAIADDDADYGPGHVSPGPVKPPTPIGPPVITFGPMKPPLMGLISMGNGSRNPAVNDNANYYGIVGNQISDVMAKQNLFDGIVINIPWKEIQPTASQTDFTAIDNALANIEAYNKNPATTVKLRGILRIFAGYNAPNWVKAMDGGPITVAFGGNTAGLAGTPVTLAHFWGKNYQAAWRSLQRTLASRYDSNPLIAQISNTSCTSADDEWPALNWVGNKKIGLSSIDNLHAAGFSDAQYQQCLEEAVSDYDGWRTTYVNSIMGPFFVTDTISGYDVPQRDYTFPQALVNKWVEKFGIRLILSNQTLNYPTNPNDIPIYAMMKAAGVPLEFQTHSPKGLDWLDSVLEDRCLGGHSLELWNAGYMDQSNVSDADLLAWSQELKSDTTNDLCPILQKNYGF